MPKLSNAFEGGYESLNNDCRRVMGLVSTFLLAFFFEKKTWNQHQPLTSSINSIFYDHYSCDELRLYLSLSDWIAIPSKLLLWISFCWLNFVAQVEEWWEQPAVTVVDWVTLDGENVGAWLNWVKKLQSILYERSRDLLEVGH